MSAQAAHDHTDACYNGDKHEHVKSCYFIGCTGCNGLGYKSEAQELKGRTSLTNTTTYYYYCATCDDIPEIDDSQYNAGASCGHGGKKRLSSQGRVPSGQYVTIYYLGTYGSVYIREVCYTCKDNQTAQCGKNSGWYYDSNDLAVSATCCKVVQLISPKR